jgi:hypothetical protein
VGPGVLGHDQHGHLRAGARSAEARADGSSLRLLEGALPVPARDGPADVRLRHGRLLAGHRQPRPVQDSELRCARREGSTQHSRHRIRGNVWLGEGVEISDLEQIEGPATSGTTVASRRGRASARTPSSRTA